VIDRRVHLQEQQLSLKCRGTRRRDWACTCIPLLSVCAAWWQVTESAHACHSSAKATACPSSEQPLAPVLRTARRRDRSASRTRRPAPASPSPPSGKTPGCTAAMQEKAVPSTKVCTPFEQAKPACCCSTLLQVPIPAADLLCGYACASWRQGQRHVISRPTGHCSRRRQRRLLLDRAQRAVSALLQACLSARRASQSAGGFPDGF